MESQSLLIQLVFSVAIVAAIILAGPLVAAVMNWVERRQGALVQRRVGPNRIGILGFGQVIADSIKLMFKEDFVPPHVNRVFYILAPVISAAIALCALIVIPYGGSFEILGEKLTLQAINVNAGFLVLFALAGLEVFGVALAGWSSNNKFALLGGLRSSAQMVSYELAMGVSLIPLVIIYGTFDLQEIVAWQSGTFFGFLPAWGIFVAPVSFVIFVITMFAETNRVPFDLSEGESELVAGVLTEYGSLRWSVFFIGEYAMMFALSCLAATLFLGGFELPWITQASIMESLVGMMGPVLGQIIALAIGVGVLIVKASFFMFLFVQVRWTVPRFRYDQLMKAGWYYMLPASLANLVITAIVAAAIKF